MPDIKRIDKQDDLVALANVLGVRHDWHEPDEQEVTAEVSGKGFDNSGAWGQHEVEFRANVLRERELPADWWSPESMELYVTVRQNGEPVAEVNLATLFAWACGYRDR